ncbi:TPA: hypothetical protein ACWSSV_004977, partial [Klebsiella pneumoniae]
RAYCLKTQPATGETYPKSDLFNKAVLTACEREFIHAIHSRQIFPVFQPIVDDNLRVQGFEILSRWRKDNIVLKSDEFLLHIHSEYA